VQAITALTIHVNPIALPPNPQEPPTMRDVIASKTLNAIVTTAPVATLARVAAMLLSPVALPTSMDAIVNLPLTAAPESAQPICAYPLVEASQTCWKDATALRPLNVPQTTAPQITCVNHLAMQISQLVLLTVNSAIVSQLLIANQIIAQLEILVNQIAMLRSLVVHPIMMNVTVKPLVIVLLEYAQTTYVIRLALVTDHMLKAVSVHLPMNA
jgi:hypothetical protein